MKLITHVRPRYVPPTIDHSHEYYIKGWRDCIDWIEAGYHGLPEFPLSAYYYPIQYKSWTAGCHDADQYLTSKQ